jgi:hypothetical protein
MLNLRRRCIQLGRVLGAATIALSSTMLVSEAGTAAPASVPPSIGACAVFPANNIWNTPIDTLPVHARSDAWITSIGATTGLHPDIGSGLDEGVIIGIPYAAVPGSQPPVSITFEYDDESDHGDYRIPPDVTLEGGTDEHVIVVDQQRCTLAEVFDASQSSPTSWTAGSGAIFDLKSNALRPDTWTSADAAGLPILPGLVRYDEVAAGEIAHALRFTVQRSQKAYLWPARHYASDNTNPNLPPMGARVRLKSSVNVAGFSPEVRVILVALQRYGMFLADNGSNWFVSGAPDERWNNDNLATLKQIIGNNLEFVDESSLIVSPDSGEARSLGASSAPPPVAVQPAAPQPQTRPETQAAQPKPQAKPQSPQASQEASCNLDGDPLSCPNANLAGANLSGRYFHAADLRGANLRGADLRMTILTEANLDGADLTDANLDTATLTDARLTNAILVRTNFFSADVGAVDFTGATFSQTVCSDGSVSNGPPCPN